MSILRQIIEDPDTPDLVRALAETEMRAGQLAADLATYRRMHAEEQHARQNYEAICRNYEAAQAKVLDLLDERLVIAEETARFATMGHTDIWWLRHVMDHAENAASLCRACFEGSATCDDCLAKARENHLLEGAGL